MSSDPGRRVLVTGAAGGLGLEVALRLAARGCDLAIADLDAERLAAAGARLREAGAELLTTLSAYVEQAGTVDGAARLLFVHPNTVRYRLRRVAELTGEQPADARSAFVLRVALVLGRLADGHGPTPNSGDTALHREVVVTTRQEPLP